MNEKEKEMRIEMWINIGIVFVMMVIGIVYKY